MVPTALAVHTKDLDFIPSTHMAYQPSVGKVPGDLMPHSGLCRHEAFTYMEEGKISYQSYT